MLFKYSSFIVLSLVLILVVTVAIAWTRHRPQRLPISDVSFPCVRLYSDHEWEGIDDATELESMPSGRYMNRRREPILIDSSFRILDMVNLKMKGSELGLLMRGPGRVPIAFDLMPQPQQSQTRARSLLVDAMISHQARTATEIDPIVPPDASLSSILSIVRSAAVSAAEDEALSQ